MGIPANRATRSARAGVTARLPVATFWRLSHSYRSALASGPQFWGGAGPPKLFVATLKSEEQIPGGRQIFSPAFDLRPPDRLLWHALEFRACLTQLRRSCPSQIVRFVERPLLVDI